MTRIRPVGAVENAEARTQLWDAWGCGLLCVSLLVVFALKLGTLLLGHNDLGWHLAAGDLIRETGTLPRHDPWSFTAGAKPWLNLSWGWDVAASALAAAFGLKSLMLMAILTEALIAGGLYATCIGAGASPLAAALAVAGAGVLFPVYALPDIYLAASPNLATAAFCVLFYALCLRRAALWLLPLAMVAWVNLHGGFTLGLFIVAVFLAVALVRRTWLDARSLALTALGCGLAVFVNPLGIHVVTGVTETLGHFVQSYITEWRPFLEIVPLAQAVPTFAYAGLFVALELTTRRGAPLEARLLSWIFLAAGFWQLRYLSIFFLFATVPVAVHLAPRMAAIASAAFLQRGMALLGPASVVVLASAGHLPSPGAVLPGPDPVAEIDYLSRNRPGARLLNHWNYGSYLIYRTRGAIPVFVDGRAATAYPDAVLGDYFGLAQWAVNEDEWRRVLGRYDIDTVLWVKAHEPLAEFFAHEPGWRLAFSGDIANVYVREAR